MIKEYFTDGLIQIAIILSLLRTDLNNWHLHNNYINYPEVQAIILGQSQAYTTTSFHNQYNTYNSLGGSVHLKNIDNDFSSAIFRELRSLSRFRRFDGISTEVNAFLVSETALGLNAATAVGQAPTNSIEEDSNNNHPHPVIPTQNTSASVQENVTSLSSENDNNNNAPEGSDENIGAVGFQPSSLPGAEPTDEDLDLIEVLWRQDIDLGVGKDAFDINLRRELERDRELELQKKREKQKELELLRQKAEEEKRLQSQQWIEQNFTQDGETGEWIPLHGNSLLTPPPDVTQPLLNDLSLEEALDILKAETGGFVDTDFSPVPESSPPLSMPPQPHLSPTVPGIDNFLLQPDNYNNQSVQQTATSHHLGRQDSYDQQWNDLNELNNLLGLAGIDGSHLPSMNNSQLPVMNNTQYNMNSVNSVAQMNITNMNNHQTNVSSMMSINSDVNTTNTVTSQPLASPCTVSGNVLLQNATMPSPVANVSMPVVNTTNMSPINSTGFLPPTADFNSSIPNTEAIPGTELDWTTGDMLFSNVTSNQTDPLDDAGDILPRIDELDRVIHEGLQTMQMLDEASSDSAMSMGSASPIQEFSDSGAMSPYDGLEGATGGSDYGSPSYSKASKYDPEEYHYGYSSCSYSHSDSSQTNYSTSSNDTDINKPHGGNNHINHNHTYPLKPGASPKEIKTSLKNDKSKIKGPHSRDIRKAQELKIPFTVDQIIESPVEEFNEMITKYKLTEPQIQLIRDIRRRGKNKVAAQNCRKRKLDVVVTLEDEMSNLKELKEQLLLERKQIDKQTRDMKEKFSHMYQEIFHSLRDEHGHPYDPNEYSLQQSSDGNVFLVPRNVSADDQMNGKKRKNEKNFE